MNLTTVVGSCLTNMRTYIEDLPSSDGPEYDDTKMLNLDVIPSSFSSISSVKKDRIKSQKWMTMSSVE